MKQIPDSWMESTLGSLCQYVTSGSREWSKYYAEAGALFVRTQDINTNRLAAPESIAKVCLPASVEGKRTLIRKHDLLITITGANVGRCAHVVVDIPEAYVSQSVALVRLREPNLGRFVHLQLLAPSDISGKTSLEARAYGMGRPVLNLDNVRETPVFLPPMQEQERIADKLDTVLARVDAVNERLTRVAPLLKRFRQSVLAAATSGRLTEDWRSINGVDESADPSSPPAELSQMVIPPTWSWKSVSALSTKVTDGVHKKPTYLDKGVPFLTVGNLTAGPGIDFSTTRFVSEVDHAEYCKRTHPEKDDILVTKDGTLGVVRRIETDRPFSIFVSLALVKLIDKRQSPYVSIALASPHLQIQMKGVGTGLQHIHLTDLRKDLLPIPPLDEQAEIVRRVETLFAFADRLEARLQAAQTAADRLTPSLLAKAFRGELVPQDPNDEPASELLKRLAASTTSSAPKRGRAKAVKAV